ncbi:MAG TPA: TIGR03085 family metal-binding protein [Dermatophilaceae bacterium]|nr:TIGR03085 family metal-binding protein [Dermatophilaceae bacterium]
MTRYAQLERHALADTMLAVGPDAPTLCDPWRVRDLAAHLIIRETRPDLAAGMFVPRLQARLERAQDELAATDFGELVERVRSGPPRWSAAGVPAVDEAMNRMEFFVHHEDVLRGDPTTPRRDLDPGLAKAVWSGLIRTGGLLYRRAPVGVILVADGVGRQVVRRPSDVGSAVVRGSVAELVMYSYGRKRAADVKITGPQAAVAALTATDIAL